MRPRNVSVHRDAEECGMAIQKKMRRAVVVVGSGKLRHEIRSGADWSSRRENFTTCGKVGTSVEFMTPGGSPMLVSCAGCNKG